MKKLILIMLVGVFTAISVEHTNSLHGKSICGHGVVNKTGGGRRVAGKSILNRSPGKRIAARALSNKGTNKRIA